MSQTLTPRSLPELAKICQESSAHKSPLLICGHGSKQHWLPSSSKERATTVTTSQLPERWEHAPADLVVTLSAGMSFCELQTRLSAAGQFVAIAPPYPDQATIGGVIATGITGSLRHRYGGVRDMVLGIEFVASDGTIAKAGGKVVKNVAGYDLMKLLTGSWGTLAIITAVTLRLHPHPPTHPTLSTTAPAADIAKLVNQLWRSGLTPTIVDLISTATEGTEQLKLQVQFTGLAPATAGQVAQFLALAPHLPITETALAHPDWNSYADRTLCRLGILPAQAIALAQKFAPHYLHLHLNSGLGIAQIPQAQIPALTSYCQEHQGYVQILNPPQPLDRPPHPLNRPIKQQLDPFHILPSLAAIGKS